MSLNPKAKAKLRELPDKPGVYIMRDRNGRVIYVGKAVSLRKRVRTYFREGTLRSADPKLRGLINSVDDFDYIVVRSDAEATLTEGQMIKDYRPRYNVFFRDDKRFLMLRVDLNTPFPRFETCRIKKNDQHTYFGPYASAGATRATLDFVEKRFGIRQCRPRVPTEEDYKHCLNDVIRFCSAPCIEKISAEAYRGQVDEACAFLRGEKPELIKELEQVMERESADMQFERAAELRDTIRMLRRTVRERAKGTRSPQMKAEDAMEGIREIKDVLGLPVEPRLIEAFDISNISGTHAVGSMVCAVDGLPRRSYYRHFRIKTVDGIDDPGMMAEVVRRRYSRVLTEKGSLPDLVLVDGGITQLRAAIRELEALELEHVPVAGLAKRYEEIHQVDGRVPVRLPAESAALRVFQRLRDEAHRFALTHHRGLRNKRIRDSALDEIPGIGKKRKEAILKHFGSVDRLRSASPEQIQEIDGIGREMAQLIIEALRDGSTGPMRKKDFRPE